MDLGLADAVASPLPRLWPCGVIAKTMVSDKFVMIRITLAVFALHYFKTRICQAVAGVEMLSKLCHVRCYVGLGGVSSVFDSVGNEVHE